MDDWQEDTAAGCGGCAVGIVIVGVIGLVVALFLFVMAVLYT